MGLRRVFHLEFNEICRLIKQSPKLLKNVSADLDPYNFRNFLMHVRLNVRTIKLYSIKLGANIY